MTFLDDVIDDLPTFLDEHAVDALWNGVTYKVIFHNEHDAISLFEAEIDSRNPYIQGRESDFLGIVQGNTVTIGGIAYKVKSPQPDGTGMVLIEFSKD